MARGRPPVPDAVKRMRGTDQPCRMNPDSPKYASDGLRPPKRWDRRKSVAYKHWKRVVPYLVENGLANDADQDLLEAMCDAYEEMRSYSDQTLVEPLINAPNGQLMPHPAFRLRDAAAKRWSDLQKEFGIGPVSRTRLKATPPKKKADEDSALKGLRRLK